MCGKPLKLLVCNSFITETMVEWQDCGAFGFRDNGRSLRVSEGSTFLPKFSGTSSPSG